MTKQQLKDWKALRIYRLRADSGLCLVTGHRFMVISAGAMKTATADRGRLLSHYVVAPN